MNNKGFTVYVTILYIVLFTTILNVIILKIGVDSYAPSIYKLVANVNKDNIQLYNCISSETCELKHQFKSDKELIIEYLKELETFNLTNSEVDKVFDDISEIAGEDSLWFINSDNDLVLGENNSIIYRFSIEKEGN